MTKADLLIARLRQKLNVMNPSSPEFNEVANRVGMCIVSHAKLNIRSQRLIDTGRLLNSITYELINRPDGVTIRVGSLGVPYAAIHEFGFRGTMGVDAFIRRQTQVFGRVLKNPIMVNVRSHQRRVNIPARPYLYPAIETCTPKIESMIREVVRG